MKCGLWYVFECTEYSADRSSSSSVAGLWPHTTWRSAHLLQESGWDVFIYYPPYSSDLASSELHIFLQLKKFLSGQRQRFQNYIEAEMSVTVVPIPGRVLWHRIQKLVPWYDKCLNSGGKYVWKLLALAASVPINLSFCFCKWPKGKYFVYELT